MGTILRNYRPKPSHMDPVRSIFDDFPPDLAFSNLHSLDICYIEGVYLLYGRNIVLCRETRVTLTGEGGISGGVLASLAGVLASPVEVLASPVGVLACLTEVMASPAGRPLIKLG